MSGTIRERKIKRRKKKRAAIIIAAALLCVILFGGAAAYIFANYNFALGSLYRKGEPMDLRGKSVSAAQYDALREKYPDEKILWQVPIGQERFDFDSVSISVGAFSADEVGSFAYLTRLRSVDARAVADSSAVIALIDAYPQLDVDWSIPVGERRFDSDSREISVGDFSADEIPIFAYFTALERIDASDASCYPELLALAAALPDCEISWSVPIGGLRYSNSDREIVLSPDATADELMWALEYLPAADTVDLTDAPISSAEVKALEERYPGAAFIYKIELAGQVYMSNAESISIPAGAPFDTAELIAVSGDFERLGVIDLGGRVLELDDIIAVREAFGGAEVLCRFNILGKDCLTEWTELDLSDRHMESTELADKAIRAMPRLEKIYLINCGLDYADLAELNDRYENVRVVWKVYLNGFGCRTDADNFCMSKYSNSWGYLPYANAEPIKYCTDMVTLDLGHGNFDRIDFVSTMPHLKYLIICSAPVTSLEPLRNCTELYYLEMFFTQVHDLGPILELPNLQHLNISHCRLDDYTQLFEMKQLKRLWWVDSGLTAAQQQELRDALPDTVICFWAANDDAVGNYWRDDPSYQEMRDNLGMNYNIIG